jgi:hypothetical protein
VTTAPLSITVQGEEQVKLAITRVSRAMALDQPVGGLSLWDRFATAFHESERELFEKQGSTGRAGAWDELSEPYRTRKASMFPGAGILVATGAMRASLVGKTGDSILKATATTLEVGTTRLAGYHWAKGRKAIDVGEEQEKSLFGRALAEWGNAVRKEWEQ